MGPRPVGRPRAVRRRAVRRRGARRLEDLLPEVLAARGAARRLEDLLLAVRRPARRGVRLREARRLEVYQEVRHRTALCSNQISRRFYYQVHSTHWLIFHTGAARHREVRRPEPPAERLRGVRRPAGLLRGAPRRAARRHPHKAAAARPRSPARPICRNSASSKCMW